MAGWSLPKTATGCVLQKKLLLEIKAATLTPQYIPSSVKFWKNSSLGRSVGRGRHFKSNDQRIF